MHFKLHFKLLLHLLCGNGCENLATLCKDARRQVSRKLITRCTVTGSSNNSSTLALQLGSKKYSRLRFTHLLRR